MWYFFIVAELQAVAWYQQIPENSLLHSKVVKAAWVFEQDFHDRKSAVVCANAINRGDWVAISMDNQEISSLIRYNQER